MIRDNYVDAVSVDAKEEMLDESESEPKGAVDANIDQSTDNTIETVE